MPKVPASRKSPTKRKAASKPRPTIPPQVLTVSEVCYTLRLGRSSTNTLIHSGQLGHVRVGDRILVPVFEIEAFLVRKMQRNTRDD